MLTRSIEVEVAGIFIISDRITQKPRLETIAKYNYKVEENRTVLIEL